MAESIATAKPLCRDLMDEDIPCFVEGPPGVGKSEMWAQIVAECQAEEDRKKTGIRWGFKDLRLAQMDPVDLRGVPSILTDENGTRWTTWARPDMWPVAERDGERGVILFDELSDCGRAMQSAAYQPILSGQVGPHEIPRGWYRCAAGNRRADKAGAQQVSTALANRFAWISIEADAECLIEYGISKGWHHYVLAFLKQHPAKVHTMEGADERAFASPRSWEKVARGKICDKPADRRTKLIAANVGLGVATEFDGYLKLLDLPDMAEIVRSPKTCPIPKNPSSRFALSSMISRYLSHDNFGKVTQYLTRAEFGRDFEICCVLDASKRDGSLCDNKAFSQFIDRNQDLQL